MSQARRARARGLRRVPGGAGGADRRGGSERHRRPRGIRRPGRRHHRPVIVCEELSRSLGGLDWLWGITVWSGAKALCLHGSDEQRSSCCRRSPPATLTFAFAFTEPGGGTDVLRAMRTRARAGRRRLAAAREQDLVDARARRRPHPRARAHGRTSKPTSGLTMFICRREGRGRDGDADPEARHALARLCEVQLTTSSCPTRTCSARSTAAGGRHGTLNSERIMVAAICTGTLAASSRT